MKGQPQYAIIRSEKRHDLSQLHKSEAHNLRTQPTPNADPEKPSPTLLLGVKGLSRAVRSRIPSKRRKDAVIAVETVLTASPDFFKDISPKRYQEWISENLWFLKERYGDNLIQVVLHEDEKTPHLHAYWVPMTHDKRLSYKSIEGTRQALVDLQDQYAHRMAPFGLVRGKEHSEQKHKHHSDVSNRLEALEHKIDKALSALATLAKHVNTLAGITALNNVATALLPEKPKPREAENVGGYPVGGYPDSGASKASQNTKVQPTPALRTPVLAPKPRF